MSRFLRFSILLAFVTVPAFGIDTGPAFEDAALQQRYEKIIRNVRCLTCQNQSIKDSNSILASDLRREVREQLAAGATNQEIFDFLTERYGEFALYKPPLNARTLVLWAAPPVFLLLAGVVLVRVVRKRSQLSIDEDSAA